MKDYGPETYGDAIADRYDAWFADLDERTLDRLLELAGEGPALELGIGTGRVALPLVERGLEVHGVEASSAMIDRLRRKFGGAELPVTRADFSDFAVDRSYPLVFVVFNTLFALTTQEEQVRCFRCVASALQPGGRFVVEAFVPDLGRFDRGQAVRAFGVEADQVQLECSSHDAATQTVQSQLIELSPKGFRLHPLRIRYAWPSEMDLMAELAGLRLAHRWSDWDGGGFTALSGQHVSVYERAG